jgi:hypothetical protein
MSEDKPVVRDLHGSLGSWGGLEALEETLDLLSTPGAVDQIREAEADISEGNTTGTDELWRLLAQRAERERRS